MKKSGLDWFPFETHLDDRFAFIEAEFGLKGFAVVVKLLQKIYQEQGYYCEWTNRVGLLFGIRECGLPAGDKSVLEIVSASIREGIFDKEKYEKYSILTSEKIQERYFDAVSRRVQVEVKEEYLLIKHAQKSKDVNRNQENVSRNKKTADKNEQIRKDNKREDNIIKDNIKAEYIPPIIPLTGEYIPQGGEDAEAVEKAEVKRKRFTPPGVEEVQAYCQERNNGIDAQSFCDFYESKGWVIGKSPMKDWRAAVRTWERGRDKKIAVSRPQSEFEKFAAELAELRKE